MVTVEVSVTNLVTVAVAVLVCVVVAVAKIVLGTVTEVVVVAAMLRTAVLVVLAVGTERHLQAELRAWPSVYLLKHAGFFVATAAARFCSSRAVKHPGKKLVVRETVVMVVVVVTNVVTVGASVTV